MYRLIWCILLAVAIASNCGASEDEIKRAKKVHRKKLESVAENLEQEMLKLLEKIEDIQEKQDRDKQESWAVAGFPLEVLRTEHDSMLQKLKEIREDVQEQRKSNEKNHEQLAQTLKLLTNIQQEMQQRHTESQKAIADINAEQERNFKSQDSIGNCGKQLERDNKQLLDINLGTYRSCKDVPIKVSGKSKIRGGETSTPFIAYCDQNKSGGGWMVVQHRFDGKLNFNRNWNEYRNGFGEVDGEHWIGLERIHQMTKEQNRELLVELRDFDGNYKYARYDLFAIGSEAEKYKLIKLGTYSGTAGDALRNHVGMKFSTPDRDNDEKSDGNCAVTCVSGWWFNNCGSAFLNGLYKNIMGPAKNNIAWYDFNNDWRGLSYSRMMIRPSN